MTHFDGEPREDETDDKPEVTSGKDVTPAQPEPVVPENASDPSVREHTTVESTRTQDPGVQTGGLTYRDAGEDEDGLPVRHYPEQAEVDVDEDTAPAGE